MCEWHAADSSHTAAEIEVLIPQASIPLPTSSPDTSGLSLGSRTQVDRWSVNNSGCATRHEGGGEQLETAKVPDDSKDAKGCSSSSLSSPPGSCSSSISRRPEAVYVSREIPLKEIYFYQDYISQRFMDGRPLMDTIVALQRGTVTPHTLPPMQCLKFKGRWFGMGNRRLACYHYVFRHDPNKMIPVQALELADDDVFNALGTGKHVRVGGGLRLVEMPNPSEFEKLSPRAREEYAEVAELRATHVYMLDHCTEWKE